MHEHLDGGLRPPTLFEPARARGLAVPTDGPDALADWMHANANCGNLGRCLRGFALTVASMATVPACERVAPSAATRRPFMPPHSRAPGTPASTSA